MADARYDGWMYATMAGCTLPLAVHVSSTKTVSNRMHVRMVTARSTNIHFSPVTVRRGSLLYPVASRGVACGARGVRLVRDGARYARYGMRCTGSGTYTLPWSLFLYMFLLF